MVLQDKFEVVCKKVSNGKNFTGTVSKYVTVIDCELNNEIMYTCRFLQKRAQIESTYAKSLAKLCKDKTFSGELEIGYTHHILLLFINTSSSIHQYR